MRWGKCSNSFHTSRKCNTETNLRIRHLQTQAHNTNRTMAFSHHHALSGSILFRAGLHTNLLTVLPSIISKVWTEKRLYIYIGADTAYSLVAVYSALWHISSLHRMFISCPMMACVAKFCVNVCCTTECAAEVNIYSDVVDWNAYFSSPITFLVEVTKLWMPPALWHAMMLYLMQYALQYREILTTKIVDIQPRPAASLARTHREVRWLFLLLPTKSEPEMHFTATTKVRF